MSEPAQATISARDFDAAIFDMDGVVTDTAKTHAAVWKRLFDDVLRECEGPGFTPFDIEHDYLTYVDGRPRYDGVKTFLQSRGIDLPFGDPADPPERTTVCGLGNAKNRYFRETVSVEGASVFDDALALIQRLKSVGIAVAVVTASKNCDLILEAAGLSGLFDARVDGVDIERLGLKGKPAPDSFVEAARRLGAEQGHSVVFEDALVGVEAGRRGSFGMVVGVGRHGDTAALLEHGADICVPSLDRLEVEGLFSALDRIEEIASRLKEHRLAVCLDYDGTLTPIVSRPDQALLSDTMRAVLCELAGSCTVAIVSGRALADIRKLVGLDITYLADHGFELAYPTGSVETYEPAAAAVAEVRAVARKAENRLRYVRGVLIEPKPFSVAIHYRLVDDADVPKVYREVDQLLSEARGLRLLEGKKVHEFRPDLDWDKGKAVKFLAERTRISLSGILYIGDDITDEDAFRTVRGKGTGIVVWDSPRMTAASYTLSGPAAVELFLKHLTEFLRNHDNK